MWGRHEGKPSPTPEPFFNTKNTDTTQKNTGFAIQSQHTTKTKKNKKNKKKQQKQNTLKKHLHLRPTRNTTSKTSSPFVVDPDWKSLSNSRVHRSAVDVAVETELVGMTEKSQPVVEEHNTQPEPVSSLTNKLGATFKPLLQRFVPFVNLQVP